MSSPISKSAFMKAEQCLKHFFLYKNHPYLRDSLSKEKQLIFKRGTDVGVFAQQLFPNGIDVTVGEKRDQQLFAEKTKHLIAQGTKTIYEATFIFDDLLVMVDILHKQEDKWIAYEVKSSLKITDTYVKDACFQYYVIKNCLPDLVDFNLLTLNPKYVLEGELEIQKLFKATSIMKDALKNADYFSHKTQIAKLSLEQNKIPDIKIGAHCFQPYDCDFLGTCWKNINEPNSVLTLGKLTKQAMFELYDQNIKRINEIDIDTILHKEVKIQVKAAIEQKEQIFKEEVELFVSNIKQPACSLDIEVWMPAIPYYNGTKPFQQIPFLFSMISEDNGIVKNYSYFKPIEEDFRREFLEHILLVTKDFQSILMFDKSLEETVLNQLAVLYPEYTSDIANFKNKIVDLAEPIRKGNYYHPEMKGNFTLKSIAPLVNQESGFDNLGIQSGISAMYMYESLLEQNAIEAEHIKQQLVDYCEMDALITYQLLNFFKSKISN
jgi:predicted RecB family nuclease